MSKVIELLVLLDGYCQGGWLAGWLGMNLIIVIALASLEPINLRGGKLQIFATIREDFKKTHITVPIA